MAQRLPAWQQQMIDQALDAISSGKRIMLNTAPRHGGHQRDVTALGYAWLTKDDVVFMCGSRRSAERLVRDTKEYLKAIGDVTARFTITTTLGSSSFLVRPLVV